MSKIPKYDFFNLTSKKKKKFGISISTSTIKGAGMGAFATEDIPKGMACAYIGRQTNEKNANMLYSWTIYKYNFAGNPDYKTPLYYIDASRDTWNWTKFVNCGMKNTSNNLDSIQKFNVMYYVTKRKIQKGEELFIDYGEEYRIDNLGMSKKY